MHHAVHGPDRLPAAARLTEAAAPQPVYVDIETTGLDPFRSQVVVVGLLYAGSKGMTLEQWFADTPEQEGQLLRHVAGRLCRFPGVVTYNGTRFDLPFLQTRAARLNLTWPRLPHMDLLRLVEKWQAMHGLLQDAACRLCYGFLVSSRGR